MICYRVVDSPIGPLTLVAGDAGLRRIHRGQVEPGEHWRAVSLEPVVVQLREYFAGERHRFDLALDPAGTPFQHQVWKALRAIPYGETRTYGQLAASIGRPGAARAVGSANRANPLPIVVPCHRVIGAGGRLTGFVWGLDTKRDLLRIERWQAASGPLAPS